MKTVKRTHGKKSAVLLTSLILVITFAVGGTIAYLVANSGSVVNTFVPGNITTEIVEENEDGVKKNVAIWNKGNTPAYVRAAVIVTWKDEIDGNVYGQKPEGNVNYSIEYNLTDWFLGDDGFYYSIEPVPAESTSKVLITSCSPIDEQAPDGYSLDVEILGSAIQCEPESVVEEFWPAVTVSDNKLQKSSN